ncbi:MAG: hypothetical protein CW691_05600, partial [Candidatus Bathyarchaeum sp.]
AQTILEPSVPEFTLQYVDHSYDVPLTYTYSTDPYTGEQIATPHGGYHVENKTVDIIVKNQPFTSTKIDGNTTKLYYGVSFKGYYEPWTDENVFPKIYEASNSDYTVIIPDINLSNIKEGGKIDIHVKAIIGFYYVYFGGHTMPIGMQFYTMEQSSWSSTQTITIGETPASATPSPTVPEFPFVAVLPLLAVIPLITILVKKRICLKAYN